MIVIMTKRNGERIKEGWNNKLGGRRLKEDQIWNDQVRTDTRAGYLIGKIS